MAEALRKGDKVHLFNDLGTFEMRERKQRNAINPRTGERIIIPAKIVPHFKIGRRLKEAVKKGKPSIEEEIQDQEDFWL
ncbi:HU family DNA-binding protein, partial [Caldisericum exile]|uniref:DNA-binding protein n=1 Tax=Caldisericum exile (strain DSM 21853 / NBRC 104410 / AZM16c01) TaxID=511051 RepID=A0A7U6GD93_CALEA